MNLELWKKIKEENDLSYDSIAEKSGIPKTTVTNIFCGYVKTPRIDTVQAIEKALGISDESGWTKEDRESDISEHGKVTVTPDELELLGLYNSIGYKFGKARQETIIKLLTAMANEEKI